MGGGGACSTPRLLKAHAGLNKSFNLMKEELVAFKLNLLVSVSLAPPPYVESYNMYRKIYQAKSRVRHSLSLFDRPKRSVAKQHDVAQVNINISLPPSCVIFYLFPSSPLRIQQSSANHT